MGKASMCIQMLELLNTGRVYKKSELAELLNTNDFQDKGLIFFLFNIRVHLNSCFLNIIPLLLTVVFIYVSFYFHFFPIYKSIFNKNTVKIITHFSHNANPVKERVEKVERQYGVIAAYDGLSIEI